MGFVGRAVRFLVYALIFVGLFFFVFFFEKEVSQKKIQKSRAVFKSVEFKTNGSITGKFLIKALSIEKGTDLAAIDIFALRDRLLKISQIRDACVERRFPGTVVVKIVERIPLLKFAIKDKNGIGLFFVDGDDGSVFRCACLSKSTISSVLTVDLNLKKSDKEPYGYEKIGDIGHVNFLLKTLQKKYRWLYDDIKKISLKEHDPRRGAPWSRIGIFRKNGQNIFLNSENLNSETIEKQLLRLDFIFKTYGSLCAKGRVIEMSNIGTAIVE